MTEAQKANRYEVREVFKAMHLGDLRRKGLTQLVGREVIKGALWDYFVAGVTYEQMALERMLRRVIRDTDGHAESIAVLDWIATEVGQRHDFKKLTLDG